MMKLNKVHTLSFSSDIPSSSSSSSSTTNSSPSSSSVFRPTDPRLRNITSTSTIPTPQTNIQPPPPPLPPLPSSSPPSSTSSLSQSSLHRTIRSEKEYYFYTVPVDETPLSFFTLPAPSWIPGSYYKEICRNWSKYTICKNGHRCEY
eukprot:TRINITY_DN2274_c2_g1_i1.p1 TRINITY_DN2274_c2_g1~~TRINITY_DN2274_c2_g1_i1.p1  ORF type:complete len:147 (+),score=73.75 TRINITY_DN2274_c2_g1_i1:86-526(+)